MGCRETFHAIKSCEIPFNIKIAPRKGRIVSALLKGSDSKKTPLPKVTTPMSNKIHAQRVLESNPKPPNNCNNPIKSNIIPIKIINILTITDGEVMNTIPNTIFIIPCPDQLPFTVKSFSLFDTINVINPPVKSNVPIMIITVFIVTLGKKRNTPPIRMVRTLREMEFFELDTNKFLIIEQITG